MKPLVAIVGRPNVGKSTLFNRILGRRKALTQDEPGVTRDLNYAECEEGGKSFILVDTGGFEPDEAIKDDIARKVKEQLRLAIEEADLIIHVMDGRVGPTPQDKEIVEVLRKTDKPVLHVANKIDTAGLLPHKDEFYSLGVDEVWAVSAEHGLGVAELIDKLVSLLPEAKEEAAEELIKVAIVGRPNVGKSSLLNSLTGKPRTIVSPVAGTTRDAIDTVFGKYLFVDTAGIRKKQRISRRIEIYSVLSAIKSIERADVVLIVIDGTTGITTQDEKIAGLVEERGKACCVVVNKWDVVDKDHRVAARYKEAVYGKMPFINYAPVLFVSALTGRGIKRILPTIDAIYEEATRKIKTGELNRLLKQVVSAHRPPVYRGKEVKFYYITQTGVLPVRFTAFVNYPEGIPPSYRRYLVGRFREGLKLTSVPIRFSFRRRH
ncbi:MAG TPA: ribosome biogenesis GTPase Der [Deltaproteobacteria bacterium]|nr:ribosome biogenesis GTPase Der [Deltaproteobacteria bacterium]